MKLSKRTLAILKNFAGINQSIIFKPGNRIITLSNTRDILGRAEVEENFECEVPIYDLNEFLSALSLFQEPEIAFEDTFATIKQGKSTQKFWYADPEAIEPIPKTELKLPSHEVHVQLSKEDISALQRAASLNKADDVVFTGTAMEGQFVKVIDRKNPSSNSFTLQTSEEAGGVYNMAITIDKLKLLPLDYDVKISVKGMAHFHNAEQHIDYFLALSPGAKHAAD